jgi:diguanylate cyclase (GGDEF)-like protein
VIGAGDAPLPSDEPARRAFAALDTAPGQFSILLESDLTIRWHSSSLTRLSGWADIVGRNGTEFVHPDDLSLALDLMQLYRSDASQHGALGQLRGPETADVRLLHPDGSYVVYESQLFNLLADPAVRGYLQVSRAVPDRSDLSTAIEMLGDGADLGDVLTVIASYFRHAGQHDDAVAISWFEDDEVHTVVAAGDRRPWTRTPELVAAGRLVVDLDLVTAVGITDLDDPRLGERGELAVEQGFRSVALMPIVTPSVGEVLGAACIWSTVPVGSVVADECAANTGLKLAALAITDARSKRSLRWAASHDPLTGLLNRAEFSRRMDQLSSSDVALLYVDLDDFKPINDRFGHPVGDAVLVEVGRRIAAELGPNDVVGRLGGDEFAVMCPGIGAVDAGRVVADRIVASPHGERRRLGGRRTRRATADPVGARAASRRGTAGRQAVGQEPRAGRSLTSVANSADQPRRNSRSPSS